MVDHDGDGVVVSNWSTTHYIAIHYAILNACKGQG